MSIDLFSAEYGTLSNEHGFSAITSFAEAQPIESNQHDFKAVWTSEAIKDVAVFANTLGGILVIDLGHAMASSQ
jgi:hypothetical protein